MSPIDPLDDRPTPGPQHPFTPPPAVGMTVEGARVVLHRRTDLPLVRLQFIIEGGAASDPAEKSGLADLTASCLREGAGDRDAVAFAGALDLAGASFSVGAAADATIVQAACLKSRLKEPLALVADAVLRPRFDAAAFQRVKVQTVGALRQRDEQPSAAAAIAAARALFGEGHPLGRPSDGRAETVERIGLADVRGRFAVASAEPVSVIAAGDFSPEELTEAIAPILAGRRLRAAGLAVRLPRPELLPPVRADALRVIVVDRPAAPQSVIQFVWPGVAYGAPDRPAFAIAMTAFGGSFTSRLNDNLREKRGYTYGARARADYFRGKADDGSAGFGVVAASASVQSAVTGASVKEFMVEFERMRVGDFTEAEIEKAKAGIRNGRISSCETLEGLMGDAAMIANFRLPLDRNMLDLLRLAAVDASAANAVARRVLVPDGGVLVIAGDRRSVAEQLAPLGLPAAEIRAAR